MRRRFPPELALERLIGGGNDRGFTLLEVMIVLAMAAIIYAHAAVGAHAARPPRPTSRRSARIVASGLRQAQSTAMATRRDALLTVDVEAREFVTDRRPARCTSSPTAIDLKLYTAQIGSRERAPRLHPLLSRRQLHRRAHHGRLGRAQVPRRRGLAHRPRHHQLTMRARQAGFTLIEVVVAFVMLTLILATSYEIFSAGLHARGRARGLHPRARRRAVPDRAIERGAIPFTKARPRARPRTASSTGP